MVARAQYPLTRIFVPVRRRMNLTLEKRRRSVLDCLFPGAPLCVGEEGVELRPETIGPRATRRRTWPVALAIAKTGIQETRKDIKENPSHFGRQLLEPDLPVETIHGAAHSLTTGQLTKIAAGQL